MLAPMRKCVVALAAALLAMATPSAAQKRAQPALETFEFLGCSGDFDRQDIAPEVWRLTRNGQISFLTHTVAACGLTGRTPRVTGDNESLDLSYELYSSSDVAIMCMCEYWAKFTFRSDAHAVKSVTFDGEQAVLRGTWPGR